MATRISPSRNRFTWRETGPRTQCGDLKRPRKGRAGEQARLEGAAAGPSRRPGNVLAGKVTSFWGMGLSMLLFDYITAAAKAMSACWRKSTRRPPLSASSPLRAGSRTGSRAPSPRSPMASNSSSASPLNSAQETASARPARRAAQGPRSRSRRRAPRPGMAAPAGRPRHLHEEGHEDGMQRQRGPEMAVEVRRACSERAGHVWKPASVVCGSALDGSSAFSAIRRMIVSVAFSRKRRSSGCSTLPLPKGSTPNPPPVETSSPTSPPSL